MEENAVFVLFDPSRHFEERAEGMVEAIGGARQEEPHGVSQERGRRGPVAMEIILDRLDIVFAIPSRAVEAFVHLLGGRRR